MKGRGERAHRASVPPRPRQGDRAVTTTRSHGGAPLAAPHQLAKGEEGRAPAPLGLSGFYSYASLKAVWGLFSHPLVPGRALQLSSWLQRTPSRTGTGSAPAASAPLAGATRKGLAQPSRQQPRHAASGTPATRPDSCERAQRPELLLNSAEASRHRKVPTLHLRHQEMRFSSGGSRCYRHRRHRHPRRLLRLLPCARGSCCWWNIPLWLLGKAWQLSLKPLSPRR